MPIHRLDAQGLPPDDIEYKLAHHLLGAASPLQRDVLYALLGRPKRFTELRPLVKGRSDNNLTHALKALRLEGVIDQRVESATRPPAWVYELSDLGIDVVRVMERLGALQVASRALASRPARAAHVR
ncbi:MAG: helix-turn-helix transcriptional regulator [Euryarchaeota archaeon]|nr:helix-turn-helix transcriptional regulator [Euryarchaeota archaeon]